MAWDVAGTKRRIYAAALAEFAAHGPDGTTVDRIAKRAGINRERVYKYFGDKARLFSIVISSELQKIAEAVPLTITSVEDVGRFAAGAFDYQRAHPELARLVLWEGLADTGVVADEATRTQLYGQKVAAVAAAQEAGIIDDQIPPGELVLLLISLTSYWCAAPQITRMLSGHPSDPDAEVARRREAVVRAAQRIAEPRRRAHPPEPRSASDTRRRAPGGRSAS